MGNTIYQLVYKSSYHGDVYSDPRAVPLPPEVASCPAAEIMEIVKVETSDNSETIVECLQSVDSALLDSALLDSAGMSFPDFASAAAAMKTMSTMYR